ncbi:hypothetical protein AKJ16_DCAP27513, partial [Drosera capensis]
AKFWGKSEGLPHIRSSCLESVYDFEDIRILGSLPPVHGPQDPFPPRISVCQIKVCLRPRGEKSSRLGYWESCSDGFPFKETS